MKSKNVGFGLDRTEKGITLVALVLTIIIMLIVAGISFSLVMGENGIIDKAINARNMHNLSIAEEQIALKAADYGGEYYVRIYKDRDLEEDNGVCAYIAERLNGTVDDYAFSMDNNNIVIKKDGELQATGLLQDDGSIKWRGENDEKPVLSDSTYLGYYIKKGNEYAIVFADVVGQAGTTVEWSSTNNSSCTFPALTDAQKAEYKTYVISNETYTDPRTVEDSTKGFGTKPVLKVVGNKDGKDRFYALALSNLATNGLTYHWYYAAGTISPYMNDFNSRGGDDGKGSPTSKAFGAGRTNTQTMIAKWNNAEYGEKDKACDHTPQHVDMWGQIQTQVSNGWFIPTFEEWSAFGWAMNLEMLKTGVTDCRILGMDYYYWSSSQYNNKCNWLEDFINGFMGIATVNSFSFVRLCTTF